MSAPTTPPSDGPLVLPSVFAEALIPGTYASNPPFEIAFTFELEASGWVLGHRNAEFFDVQRFEGEAGVGLPVRIVGFGHPDAFRSSAGDVPVPGLEPQAAVDLLAARDDLEAAGNAAIELIGRRGVRLDIHAAAGNTPLFGGDGGTFGLGPELDIRLVVLPLGRDDLLVLAVQAPPGELDAAWAEALPILASIDLPA